MFLNLQSNPGTVPGPAAEYSSGCQCLLLLVMVLVIPCAHADQCEYFGEQAAQLVRNTLTTGAILLDYCEPCDMPEPLPLRIRNMHIEKQAVPPRSTNIDGVWYSYAEISTGRVPGLSREEQDALLQAIDQANPPSYRLLINGTVRDLAYLYYRSGPDPDSYGNLGVAAGCADGVSPVITYTFPDREQAPAPPPGPHFEDITDVCFDGSCLLKEWIVTSAATLYDDHHAGADRVVAVMPDQILTVERVLSEFTPVRAVVVFDQGRFLEGDEFFILNNLGEGYFRVWYYGRIVEEEILGVSMERMENGKWARCPEPDADCWAEAHGHPEEIWWALVKTGDGNTGWLREPAAFVDNIFDLQ